MFKYFFFLKTKKNVLYAIDYPCAFNTTLAQQVARSN